MAHELRAYQARAIDLVRHSFATGHRRPLLQIATGSGKTLIATHIIERALTKGKKVAFLVDRIQLIQQACDALDRAGLDHGVIQGKHERSDRTKPVQVISIQTLARRNPWEYELGIIDEAHCLHQAHLKMLRAWPTVPIIGLSATPWAVGMGQHFDDLIVPITIGELVAQGYLVDAQVYAPSAPDMKGAKTVAGDFSGKDVDARVRKPELIGSILSHWQALANNKRTLVMASNVAHSMELAAMFSAVGIPARHIDADTDSEDRRRIIADFRAGKVLVLCSVGVLTTGFDAPEAEVLILARPTKSRILHVQQVGRVLRPSPDSGKGSHALILDHAGNFNRLGWHYDQPEDGLDMGDKAAQTKKSESTERLPRTCPKCHLVHDSRSPECPSCGYKAVTVKPPEVRKGKLTLLERRNVLESDREKRDFYGMLRYIGAERGYSDGWASHAYKSRYGDFPTEKVAPIPASNVVRSYAKSLGIRYAKGARKYYGR